MYLDLIPGYEFPWRTKFDEYCITICHFDAELKLTLDGIKIILIHFLKKYWDSYGVTEIDDSRIAFATEKSS